MFDQFNDADAMIRANGEAERRERERLAGEVEEYRRRLEELTAMLENRNSAIQEMNEVSRLNADGLKAMMQESGEEENDEANALLSSLLDLAAEQDETPAPESTDAAPVPEGTDAEPGPEDAAAEPVPESTDAEPGPEDAAAEPVPENAGAEPAKKVLPSEPAGTGNEEDFIRNLLFGMNGGAVTGNNSGEPESAGEAEEPAQDVLPSDMDQMISLMEERTAARVSELLEANRAALADDIAALVKSGTGLSRQDVAELLDNQPRLSRKHRGLPAHAYRGGCPRGYLVHAQAYRRGCRGYCQPRSVGEAGGHRGAARRIRQRQRARRADILPL